MWKRQETLTEQSVNSLHISGMIIWSSKSGSGGCGALFKNHLETLFTSEQLSLIYKLKAQ